MKPNFWLQGEIPLDLLVAFLQHIRDFDVQNEGRCHFNLTIQTPNLTVEEISEMLDQVEPGFAQRTTIRTQ